MFVVSQAHAGIPIYYWDNQEGFVSAQGCVVEQIQNHRFRISTYSGSNQGSKTENLRNYNGVRQSHLINGSLVKLIDGKKKRDFHKVEVVGVNQMDGVEPTRWFSQRLDQGYLYYGSVLPVEDYVIRLVEGTPDYALGDQFPSVKWMYFKLAAEGNFFRLSCPQPELKSRDYIVFKAYKKHAHTPSALVGIYWDETKIFKHIETLTKYDAVPYLPSNLNEDSVEALLLDGEFSTNVTDYTPVAVEDDMTDPANDAGDAPNIGDDPIDDPVDGDSDDNADSLDGMRTIICTSNTLLNVRDESLENVIFKAKRGEQVKVFQGWGNNTLTRTIDGVEYTFKKVQFANRESEDQTIGWVANAFIKAKSQCKFLQNDNPEDQEVDTQITGLDDPKCCEFPTVKRPTHRYDSGMRRFAAGRSQGRRLHAACDLYRFKMEPILSVAPGKVVRNRYYFYQGTYAIEVVHSGGFVVRYGELDKKSIEGIKKGAKVKMGQRLGYMGKVNSNCCRPMLHFELYRGNKTGPLSVGGDMFQRRSDLMDPTPFLYRWEHDNF